MNITIKNDNKLFPFEDVAEGMPEFEDVDTDDDSGDDDIDDDED